MLIIVPKQCSCKFPFGSCLAGLGKIISNVHVCYVSVMRFQLCCSRLSLSKETTWQVERKKAKTKKKIFTELHQRGGK